FVRWEGDYGGTDLATTITVNSDMDIVGVFKKKEYPLTVKTEGEGTVSEKVISQKITEYSAGTMVELTAKPGEGWEFVNWKGATSSADNPIQVEVKEPDMVTAVFKKKLISKSDLARIIKTLSADEMMG